MENKNILQKSGFDTKIKHIDPLKIDTRVEIPGYNKDVLDDRISVTNRYLDICRVSGIDDSVLGPFNCTLSNLNVVSGNLKWKLEDNKLYIPESGTYQIISYIRYSDGVSGERYITVKKNGTTQILTKYDEPNFSWAAIVEVNGVTNLKKGDYLTVLGIRGSGGVLDVNASTSLQLIKLS